MTGPAKCSFSIDHILHVAGTSNEKRKDQQFDWLQCTRYKPPRLQRQKKAAVQRRNAGRNPRIPFSPTQVSHLENKYQQAPYLSGHEVHQLADQLDLTDTRVKIWFQNRRARERREQVTEKTFKQNDPCGRKNNEPIAETVPPARISPLTVQPCKEENTSNTRVSMLRNSHSALTLWSTATLLSMVNNSHTQPQTDHNILSISQLLYKNNETTSGWN